PSDSCAPSSAAEAAQERSAPRVRLEPGLAPVRVAGQDLVRAARSPGPLGVGLDRRRGVEQRLDDAPGLLDAVLPGEERRLSVDGVSEQALVGLWRGAQLFREDERQVD